MQTLNVQFSDSTGSEIVSYFGCPQSAQSFANLGTVLSSDRRWVSFYDAQDLATQQLIPAPNS